MTPKARQIQDARDHRLDLPEAGQLVAGTWSVPTGALDLELEDPFLGTTVGAAAESDADSVERAAAAAWAAYESGSWADLGPEGRAEVLDAVADALEPELGGSARWSRSPPACRSGRPPSSA